MSMLLPLDDKEMMQIQVTSDSSMVFVSKLVLLKGCFCV